ncbi:TPA: hypothetical protein MIU03_18290 [Klebsiella pneumoniae]|nr:hypothetical protein [Klebsiella pneumoniae]
MTITLQAVNDLIASLESAGELSIREQKFLKLAKAFKQLAAENMALKSKGKELLGEACAVYSRLNKLIDPSIGDFVDGQTLHEFHDKSWQKSAYAPASKETRAAVLVERIESMNSASALNYNAERDRFMPQLAFEI